MKRNFVGPIFFLLYLFSVAPPAEAQQQQAHYVHDGKNLQVEGDRPAQASYVQWQIWLYPERVHIPHHTAGLQYSRWGLIEGRSAESEWGQYSFLNPLGPKHHDWIWDSKSSRDWMMLERRPS